MLSRKGGLNLPWWLWTERSSVANSTLRLGSYVCGNVLIYNGARFLANLELNNNKSNLKMNLWPPKWVLFKINLSDPQVVLTFEFLFKKLCGSEGRPSLFSFQAHKDFPSESHTMIPCLSWDPEIHLLLLQNVGSKGVRHHTQLS